MTERRRRLSRAGIHATALLGLLLVALSGRIAYRTAHAFPAYAEWMARTYDTPASAALHEQIVRERMARIDVAVRRVTTYVTAAVALSLALIVTRHLLLVREISRRGPGRPWRMAISTGFAPRRSAWGA